MDRPRDEFLARSALAGDQRAGPRLGELLHHADRVAQRRVGADDRIQTVRAPDLPAKGEVLLDQTLHAQQPIDRDEDVVEDERLGDVVAGSELDGLHRTFHRAESGDHDDIRVRGHVARLGQDGQAVHLRHANVQQGHVNPARLEAPQGLLAVAGQHDLEPDLAKDFRERFANRFLVVGDQNYFCVHYADSLYIRNPAVRNRRVGGPASRPK